ncbi:hypothetical protein SNE510_51570 [Streptomyces sp. NE5-10]|uniref:hypothetical protein n=1 Tax=Streptomyces sp. NE5-10 TaxID=2759674 RepID=UPI0019050D16|nr:hypothetical protein [Streptomyces sp. NE5-10]GHJ95638.1 hypothetical protein SNE510_51570 [Streptomyces sp. NE5-10]
MVEEAADGWRLSELPGVREQLRRVVGDLEAGRNCLWLLPDRMTEAGQAEELYRSVRARVPAGIDVPEPEEVAAAVPGGGQAARPGPADGWFDGDELPRLDLDDDEDFDVDLGWRQDDALPAVPSPRRPPDGAADVGHGLMGRIAGQLSVHADDVIPHLLGPATAPHPVIGIRAWTERDPEPGHAQDRAAARGAGIERLFRTLAAETKAGGLPPGERPRILAVARLGDVPAAFLDELGRDRADTVVHWWWGVLGRLDTAMAVAALPAAATGPGDLADRLRTSLLRETVVEVCGPDLELAAALAARWDGRFDTLGPALGEALARTAVPGLADCPPLDRTGARRRPGPAYAEAWSRGQVFSWEGRLRPHPGVWYPAGGGAAPGRDARARLDALVSQAQQRVLMPWVEEARHRLAGRALRHLNRPVAAVVLGYLQRPAPYLAGAPERAFLELQVGELLTAHRAGALALPPDDADLVRLLVTVRNVLAHRSVLRDGTVAALCAGLSRADLPGS